MTDWPGTPVSGQKWPGTPVTQSSEPASTAPGDNRGMVDKLLGIGGERFQTFPERAVRGVASDIKGLMDTAATTPINPQAGSELGPQALKVASETYMGTAPGASEVAAGIYDAAWKAREVKASLPSADAIKASAQQAYKQVAEGKLKARPEVIDEFVSGARQELDDELVVDTNAPRTYRALDKLQKSGGDIGQLMAVRQALGKIGPREGTEYHAARQVTDKIDTFIGGMEAKNVLSGDPKFTQAMLGHARASWRAWAKLDQTMHAADVAEHRAAVTGSGANKQNALRQEFRKIIDSDSKSRGFSQETKDQMLKIVEGGALVNVARTIGKFAPSGPVSSWATVVAGLEGGPGAATVVGVGAWLAKHLGEHLTRKQIGKLADMIRKESPIGHAAESRIMAKPPGVGARTIGKVAPGIIPAAAAGTIGGGEQWKPDQNWINQYLAGQAS